MTDREKLVDALERIDVIVRDEIAPLVERTPMLKQHGSFYGRSAYGWLLRGLFDLRRRVDPQGTTRKSEVRRLDEALARRVTP